MVTQLNILDLSLNIFLSIKPIWIQKLHFEKNFSQKTKKVAPAFYTSFYVDFSVLSS